MKNRLIISILFLLLGTAIAWGPQTIFPICGVRSANESSMSGDSMTENSEHSTMGNSGDSMTENSEHSAMGNSGHTMAKKHMKCWYTGRWEIGVGSAISVFGLLFIFLKKKKIRITLSIVTFLSGIFALLIPTVLVGVCGNKHMDCHAIALPALVIFSSAVILTAAINTVFLFRTNAERLK
ncbi:MAG: DUF4418 family protein [Ruminococcus sp.]|jgi:hypothetical protein|nr:DUF4418 family protein [Ruminococcus sp.]